MARNDLSPAEHATVQLALGRIFRLAARPTRPGDVETYEAARRAILDVLAPVNLPIDTRPCYSRQRYQGAAGDP
jgi:hypothetical protein